MNFTDFNLLDFGTKILCDGLIYSDGEKDFLFYFPNTAAKQTEVVPITQEQWLALLKQTDEVNVEVTTEEDGALKKSFVKKSQRTLDLNICWQVYQRDSYTCRYCNRTGLPLTVDHIDLWEEGGMTLPENLLTCCKPCNRSRGNTYYEKWLKHPYFLKVSTALTPEQHQALQDIVATLPELRLKRSSKTNRKR